MGFADHNSSPGPEIFSSPMEYILFEYKGDCIINVNMGGANLYFMSFVLTEDEKEQSKGKNSLLIGFRTIYGFTQRNFLIEFRI